MTKNNNRKNITENKIENVRYKKSVNFSHIEKPNNNLIYEDINDIMNEKDFTNYIKLNISLINVLKEKKN